MNPSFPLYLYPHATIVWVLQYKFNRRIREVSCIGTKERSEIDILPGHGHSLSRWGFTLRSFCRQIRLLCSPTPSCAWIGRYFNSCCCAAESGPPHLVSSLKDVRLVAPEMLPIRMLLQGGLGSPHRRTLAGYAQFSTPLLTRFSVHSRTTTVPYHLE